MKYCAHSEHQNFRTYKLWHKYCAHLVLDTQMTWSMSVNVNSRSLLVNIELASANPNSEWSVNTVLSPSDFPCNIDSWQRTENACKKRISCSKASTAIMKTFLFLIYFQTVFFYHIENYCQYKFSFYFCSFETMLQFFNFKNLKNNCYYTKINWNFFHFLLNSPWK